MNIHSAYAVIDLNDLCYCYMPSKEIQVLTERESGGIIDKHINTFYENMIHIHLKLFADKELRIKT